MFLESELEVYFGGNNNPMFMIVTTPLSKSLSVNIYPYNIISCISSTFFIVTFSHSSINFGHIFGDIPKEFL